jgi:hypothetical protein
MAAIATVAALSASTPSAAAALTALRSMAVSGRLALSGDRFLFFFLAFICCLFAVLIVEVQLNPMIEVRFLQHLAQFSRTNLGVKLLLFLVIIEVVFVAFVMMTGEVILFALYDFFFHQSGSRRKRRNGWNRCGPGLFDWLCGRLVSLGRLFVRALLLAAKTEQPELCWRERIDVVRSATITLELRALFLAF